MKTLPSPRGAYAIKVGERRGQIFLFIRQKHQILSMLVIPEMETLEVSTKDFEESLTSKAIEFVEQLPKDVYDTCVAEYDLRSTQK
jgi:hypothetical protein